jgi:glycosyltransferase involved in cell wall biosynthesis
LQPQSLRVIVTLPVYKDSQFLEKASDVLESATLAITNDFMLLIAEDGSNSSDIIERLRKRYQNIAYFQNDRRLGRGKALREAWKKVQGDVYVYIDVDLATDLTKFDAYKNLIGEQREFDLVTGSRYIQGSSTARPRLRRSASIVYNSLIRMLFRTGVHDHQCGFKSFSRKLVEFLAADARSDTWFWDTEVIVLAKKLGFRVKEVPVYWSEKKGGRTPIKRLIKDIWLHGTGLLGLVYRIYLTEGPRLQDV